MGEEYPFDARETMRVRTAAHGDSEPALAARLGAASLARQLRRPRARLEFVLMDER